MDKNLDVFVSYRRSNGSELASLIKVYLQLRGFTVFIDVERLETGEFDNNLLQNIRQAKHFLLVLTPNALDRCKGDNEQKDLVHREIVAALESQCNIVLITDNFHWPNAEDLPTDMRVICHSNALRWMHNDQDACIEKLESLLRGKSKLTNHLDGPLQETGDVQALESSSIGRAYESNLPNKGEENVDKNMNVFVSYRRSNGSQLASLVKVYLQLCGFTVFIDVERLETDEIDNNLLQSIRQAKHFLLVLTPNALDRCKGDNEQKDLVHREIVTALESQCNIVPITDNFDWPNAEDLPKDMRVICHFNTVRWMHNDQDACVEKLESFLHGKSNLTNRLDGPLRGTGDVQTPGTASKVEGVIKQID